MLFLWWFGSEIEEMYGPREFLVFYLVSAVVGGLVFTIAHLIDFSGGLCIGASGAVTAVLVLYAFHYPRRIIYLFFLLPCRSGFSLLPRWATTPIRCWQQESMVAVTVHLGGAAFAFVYYTHWRIMSLLRALAELSRHCAGGWSRPRLRVYREEAPEPVRAAVAAVMEEDRIKAEMDAVLEKISRVGRQNLTENDLDVLRRASEILRRRRS